MAISDHQAKYFAHLLTQRHPIDSPDRLSGALVDAQVDLHPHQVDAALFAFKSPFSKGALLADEVGLGKTIEAGLVIAQRWAERKRRILIITPANLRKQWYQELQEKFHLPSTILEGKSYNAEVKKGNFRPFETDTLVICSYNFAKAKAAEIHNTGWDLVVIDEAHRLRNVYKPNNIIANTIKLALQNDPKLLLTATPLQNSLLELYGLVSIIDDHTFGDLKSFRDQFSRLDSDPLFEVLRERLKPICHRTLRRQVTQYVNYTNRHAMVEEFTPEDAEQQLYDDVSEYLRRPQLVSLPSGQRMLMTLVLRKLLASSTFAIAGALGTLVRRLEAKVKRQKAPDLTDELSDDYELLNEFADESELEEAEEEMLSSEDLAKLEEEIVELRKFRDLAASILDNAKGKALMSALAQAMEETERLGGQRKAIIFTESRKTQNYLVRLLEQSDYSEGIVLFNGANNDDRSKAIYKEWLAKYKDTDRVTGSKTADMRSAIVDYFRDQGQVMIATEAGAEGINLQFCSLVVNYDLPWNPQRIEQRIGRCHRYGQKHDVVVLNFVNLKNEADKRVYELLDQKFKLFDGVFGASDEILGAIESGIDLEARIAEIYQNCRRNEEINEAFDKLQGEFRFEIEAELKRSRGQLIENVDQEVIDKLRIGKDRNIKMRNRFEDLLMTLTVHELGAKVEVDGDDRFCLRQRPTGTGEEVPLGWYELPRRTGDAHLYRLGHPLSAAVIRQAKQKELPIAEITFDCTNQRPRVSVLEPHIGKSGEISVGLLTIAALDQVEDHFVYAGVFDTGERMISEDVAKMLTLQVVKSEPILTLQHETLLADAAKVSERRIINHLTERNAAFFDQEAAKLEAWADDLKTGLERELRELERQIREAKKMSLATASLQAKLEAQKEVRKLEAERSAKRRAIFESQDEIEKRRDGLIEEIEAKLQQQLEFTPLFTARWRLS